MIRDVYIAHQGADTSAGVQFALANQLNYELDSFYHPENLDQGTEVLRWQETLAEFTGSLACRGPFLDLNPVSPDARIAEVTYQRYSQAIEVCKQLHARYLVLRSRYSALDVPQSGFKSWFSKTTDFWSRLIAEQVTAEQPLTFLLENHQEDSPQHLKMLFERVGSPNFKMCLNTENINTFSNLSAVDWLDVMSHHTAYIHLPCINSRGADRQQHRSKHSSDLDGFLGHLALLPVRIDVGLTAHQVEDLQVTLNLLKGYLRLQEEQANTKSFLI